MSKAQRIRGLEENEASILVKPLYAAVRKILGKVIEPIKVQARRPAIAWFGNLLNVTIERSGKVELRIHALVQFRASQVVECPF
ncbi:MAG: hypothetical protein M3209_19140 [Acidobacteriota bacterium]|nr:hypothetical protein [Acidobacteriota bacterium]